MEALHDRVADYVPRSHVGAWNLTELLRRVKAQIRKGS